MSTKTLNGFAIVLLFLSQLLLLGGCAIPLPYAPSIELLAEQDDLPLVSSALGDSKVRASRATLALRSGRVLSISQNPGRQDYLRDLPIPLHGPDKAGAYVPPPAKFHHLQAGDRHDPYGFSVTPQFAEAMQFFLSGDAKNALRALDGILASDGQHPALLWQASYLRVDTLMLLGGRLDLAEEELRRTEILERKASGGNHVARALRAEVRLWSGDMSGAERDAAQVVRAIGTWRFPTLYLTPPSDRFELGRVDTAQVRAQMVLGHVLAAKGDFKSALPWFELASQEMNDTMYVVRHPFYSLSFKTPPDLLFGRGATLAAHGMAVLGVNPSSEQAVDLFKKAKEYFDAVGYRTGDLLIQLFKCNALYKTGRFEQVVTEAQVGIDIAEKLGLQESLWQFHAIRGSAFLRLKNWSQAEKSLRTAQNIIDLTSGTGSSNTTATLAGLTKDAITEGLVSIGLQKRGAEAEIFGDLERGRARTFVSLLASRSIASGREEALVRKIRTLDDEIAKERGRKTAIIGERDARPERERDLLLERSQLVSVLRQRDPELADVLSVSSVTLKAVQNLLAPDVAMVYVLPADGNAPIRLMLITRSGATTKSLALNVKQLRTLLDEFTATIGSGRAENQRAVLSNLRRGLSIDEWGKLKAVYVVPSGATHFVPWGALDVPFAVAVLPNGGWVTRSPLVPPRQARAAVLGDPIFGGSLAQLPGARAEAVAVSAKYKIEPLLGEAATEQELRRKVGSGVDVLHLATHALYDPVFPLSSSLILTDGKRAVSLTAEQLFQKPIPARLVVLSACETGMGKVAAGDDLLGLARSFYLGGASAVVSSLWPVEDEATRLFMEVFHERSRGGEYGVAWLSARDAVKAKGYPPSSYGAFVLGGTLGGRL